MQIRTIEEARTLVGRTFERDGKRRTVTEVNDCWDGIAVWWRTGIGFHADMAWQFSEEFNDWLSGATEVTQ